MLFYDTFAGGCNVVCAAKRLGFEVKASDLFQRHFSFVEQKDHRDVEFDTGGTAWFSPPCTDFSVANRNRTYTDRVLFANGSIPQLNTFFLENVRNYETLLPELHAFSLKFRYSFSYRCVNLRHFGSLQNRVRLIGVFTRSSVVLHKFRLFFETSPVPYSYRLADFWDSIEARLDSNCDDSLPYGYYRLHTGSGARKLRLKDEPFPTFTRSCLSRVYALKTRDGGLKTGDILELDGFPSEAFRKYQLTSNRDLAQSVVGDGVPFVFVDKLLKFCLV